MIKATSQSVCSGITGCQVEILGSGAELLREYRGVTAAMYRSLRGHMPEELAKEVLVIVFLAVVDYITGVIKGIYTKKLSSETGFKGLLKKIVMFIVIAVSFAIQGLIGNTIPLREVVIMFYICNEALSLLENAAVFVPIPDKLRDVLIQLRDKDTEEDSEGE